MGNEEPQAPVATSDEPEHPGRRVLRRSASDKVIAGVAGGLAEYFDVSPLAARTLFGLSAVVIALWIWTPLGLAVVAYLLLWIFVPRSDVGVSPAGRLAHRYPRIGPFIGVVVLLGGVAALVAQLEPWLAWAVLLIGGGILLFVRDRRWAPRSRTPGHPVAPEPYSLPEIATPAPLPLREPRPPRERSPLGWFGLGIVLLVVGIAAVMQNLGAIELRLVDFPAIALAILGATMLVGTLFGRARWLTLPALLVVPFLLGTSLITVPLEGGVGDLYEQPQTVAEVDDEYRRIVGSINLYLAALRDPNTSTTITASSGIGEIYVTVPFDAHVIATGRAGLGVVRVGRLSAEDQVVSLLTATWEPRYGDGATITLDLETGIGNISVYRQPPTRRELRELGIEP